MTKPDDDDNKHSFFRRLFIGFMAVLKPCQKLTENADTEEDVKGLLHLIRVKKHQTHKATINESFIHNVSSWWTILFLTKPKRYFFCNIICRLLFYYSRVEPRVSSHELGNDLYEIDVCLNGGYIGRVTAHHRSNASVPLATLLAAYISLVWIFRLIPHKLYKLYFVRIWPGNIATNMLPVVYDLGM